MTAQEMLDKVAAHLRSMEDRAVNEAGDCLYITETPDGEVRRCAIGIFIPDGHPALAASGGVASLIQVYSDLVPLVLPSDLGGNYGLYFAQELQTLHDSHHNWNNGFKGEDRLMQIAKRFKLTYTPPETVAESSC